MGHKGRRQKQKGGANLPQNEKTPKEAVIRAGTGLCKSGNTFKTEMRSDFIKAHWNKWWNNDLINLNTNILFCLQNEQPWHLLSPGLGEGAGDTVLLYSFTPSASSKILIFSLLLNYTGCQSTVGDILSGEIYTNTEHTQKAQHNIFYTVRDVNHRLFEARITALLEIDCGEIIHQEEESGGFLCVCGSPTPQVLIREAFRLFFLVPFFFFNRFLLQIHYLKQKLQIHGPWAKSDPQLSVLLIGSRMLALTQVNF